MNELYELIFENVATEDILTVVGKLDNSYVIDSKKRAEVIKFLSSETVDLHCVQLYSPSGPLNVFNDVYLRILKYDGILDVETNWSSFPIPFEQILKLYDLAVEVSDTSKITNFYFGAEPADDEESQLFSKNTAPRKT